MKIPMGVMRWLRHRAPVLHILLIQRRRAWVRHQTERLLLQGDDLSSSDRVSCVLFTVHRSASTFLGSVMRDLAENDGLVYVDYFSYLDLMGLPRERLFADPQVLRRAFHPHGYFYGPLRQFANVPDLSAYRVLLVLRDPRDVLTSMYYSVAFSHPLISRQLIAERKVAQRETPDAYVLREMSRFRATYEEYCAQLLGKPNVLTLRYEDMIADFDSWLRKAAAHFGWDDNESLRQSIVARADFGVPDEDVFAHRRQVRPGDHTRKLLPETQSVLATEFREVLDSLGYAGG